MSIEFRAWPKTPRLFRDITITEKIDGTNACVIVDEDCADVAAQSRNRIITPGDDNYGFAKWVRDNAGALTDVLGPGYHYGEWWGSGIQRGYGLINGDKRFYLFNVNKWCGNPSVGHVDGLGVVPVLYQGGFSEGACARAVADLRDNGSHAARGYDNPEGIIVFHSASRQAYKVLLDNDDQPKGAAA